MKASTKRIASIFVSILLLVGLLFFYSVFIRPEYGAIMEKRAEVASRQALVADYESDLSRIEELTRDYENLAQAQASLTMVIPADENTATAVMQIGGLARANRVAVRALSAQTTALQPSKQPGLVRAIGSVRFTLRAQAAYEDFRNFLRGIETNMNVMDIEVVKIETLPSLRSLQAGFLDYTISLTTFYEAE